MTTEHHTPREQLQLLAELMNMHGTVQYVSKYATRTGSVARSGWYILTGFRRLPSGLFTWDSGVWLGFNVVMARQVIMKARELMDAEGL